MILGIDIGGSGVKGAPVDIDTGTLTAPRYKVPTPTVSDTDRLVAAVREVVDHFDTADGVGVAFPGVVVRGRTTTAANLHPSWIDAPAVALFSAAVGVPVAMINDADAAGLAEMTFGVGRGQTGTTIVLTFGTGIGSAVFLDTRLLPNTELGHLELHGQVAERRAAARAREAEKLDWPEWAARVEEYLRHVEHLFQPDLFIVGGGISRRSELFLPLITTRTPIVPAVLQNTAGIVGAALAAAAAAAA
jgi:polyphosphate glucokinase